MTDISGEAPWEKYQRLEKERLEKEGEAPWEKYQRLEKERLEKEGEAPWEKYQRLEKERLEKEGEAPWEKYQRLEKERQQISPELYATTENGGEIYRLSNGTFAYRDKNYATSDQDKISEILEGAQPVDLLRRDFDEQIIKDHPIAARVQEFNQGAPLVGEWLDEGVELFSPDAAKNMRLVSDAMERQRPGQSAGLNIAGGITYAAPLLAGKAAGKTFDWIGKAGSKFGKLMRTGAVAAPGAITEGAVSMAGRGEGFEERGRNAAVGAGIGAGFGVFGSPVVSSFGYGVGGILKRAKSLDVKTISKEFGISNSAARMVRRALQADDLDAAVARLGQLGDDAMLADAGLATGALLDAGTTTGGRALAIARNEVDARANSVGKQLSPKLDALLGKVKGVNTTALEIAKETSPARKAAYNHAYSKPINYADNTGKMIEGVLKRIPSDTLVSAINEANEAMQADGILNLQIMAKIGEDRSVIFREMPNVQQLDEIKKALRNMANEAVDKYGRPTSKGLRAKRLASDLNRAIIEAVPSYKFAIKLGEDKIQRDNALDMGRNLLWKKTTVEDVGEVISDGWSEEAQKAARQGLRETIEHTLSNVRRTISDPNIDAREAMQLVKELSSRANRKKLTMVLGDKRANAIFSELNKVAIALELRAAIAQNSKTAIRQFIQEEAGAEVQPGLTRRILGNFGNPIDVTSDLTKSTFGIKPANLNEKKRELLAEVAQRLVQIRGPKAQQALTVVQKALDRQPVSDAEGQLLNQILTGSFTVGMHRAIQQILDSQ